ncbi:MAG TPA: hypothetical protein VF253_00360 [Candidatus Limnocylindrales bacterium]|jgi:hypothetical protein
MKYGRRAFVSGLLAGAMTIATIVVPAAALGASAMEPCPGGGSLLVNAYADYINSADIGADGHVWALDAAREKIQIWQIGTDTYCFKRQDTGTFTTFAGLSPEGTGAVSGGVTGRWYGELVIVIHGTFAPNVATKGFVGDFDLQCQQDGTCPGLAFNARNYFSSFDSLEFLKFSATFEGGACGVWRQSIDGNTGDIVC